MTIQVDPPKGIVASTSSSTSSQRSAIPMPPDSIAYRLKHKLLGQPLHSDELDHQRLGKPTALAVFASDNLSSSAYATEEILHVLVPVVGLAAFSLVMPLTGALLVMLALLILSYRETIKAYPSAGGAYLVTRDNFGIIPAQVAGASLLVGYVLTVSVSVSAGTAALISSFDSLAQYRVPIALMFIAVVMYGNLRGVKESGKVFAVPTYFFMLNMGVLLVYGLVRFLSGDLAVIPPVSDAIHVGEASMDAGLYLGATAFLLAKAFASGGAAVTGVEAISNGVPAFREPAWKHARQTLVVMGSGLGVMFLGLSLLASKVKVIPAHDGTPTVLAQIGEAVFGGGGLGNGLGYSLQAATMLILVLAANTGFADFPRLASFQASDSFLPRQLTKRGHRLVFSNGIFALAGTAGFLVVVTNAEVTKLIPLYAIGVFVGFTLSQAGMTMHHLRLKEAGWRRSLVINGVGACLSAGVVLIVSVTKFADGAWIMVVSMPILVVVLLRLNRQYKKEAVVLEHDVPNAVTAPILRRHVVLVFIDRLDMATARAIQYARTLTPDEMRAVHFAVDEIAARELEDTWTHTGLARVPLEISACTDRRLVRAAVELVARELADGETEVSVLLPDRKYRGLWHRILHDKTAEAITAQVSRLPHANVTSIPFHLDAQEPSVPLSVLTADRPGSGEGRHGEPPAPVLVTDGGAHRMTVAGTTPIAEARWRQRVTVAGRVTSLRVGPLHDAPTLELLLSDGTGVISVVFLGRRALAGVHLDTKLLVEGTIGIHKTRLALVNPAYRILA